MLWNCIWVLGWLPVILVVGALANPCDRTGACGLNSSRISPAFFVTLGAWFGVVLVPAALYGFGWMLKTLWENRPRRIIEPVLTDLREAKRR